jgi:uncharacterized protein involved in tolerance to divalent cations
MDAIVINCTVPDKRVAKEIAKHLIKYRLAACVSAVDKVESTFSWDGEIAKEKEVLLIIKTLRVNLRPNRKYTITHSGMGGRVFIQEFYYTDSKGILRVDRSRKRKVGYRDT